MPKKIKPKKGYEDSDWIGGFTFSDEIKDKLAEVLKPSNSDLIGKLEKLTSNFFSMMQIEKNNPTKSEIKAALDEVNTKSMSLSKVLEELDCVTRDLITDQALLDNKSSDFISQTKRNLDDLNYYIFQIRPYFKTSRGRPREDNLRYLGSQLYDLLTKNEIKITKYADSPFFKMFYIILNAVGESWNTDYKKLLYEVINDKEAKENPKA